MTHTLVRTAVSVVLGLALALPILGALQFAPDIANAQRSTSGTTTDSDELSTEDLLPSEFGSSTGLGQADLTDTIAGLIRVVLGFLGIIAVIIVLMGGFKWMTAGGNDEKVGDAKKLLIAGVIGLALILSAYAITEFVVDSVISASQ